MKFKYEILKICDGCDQEKQTREMQSLDPSHRDLKNYLCKVCDNSYHTIPKILKRNLKKLGPGDPFMLKSGDVTIYIRG